MNYSMCAVALEVVVHLAWMEAHPERAPMMCAHAVAVLLHRLATWAGHRAPVLRWVSVISVGLAQPGGQAVRRKKLSSVSL